MDEKFSRFERFYGRPLSRLEQNFYFVQVIITPLQAILDIIRRDGYAVLNFFSAHHFCLQQKPVPPEVFASVGTGKSF